MKKILYAVAAILLSLLVLGSIFMFWGTQATLAPREREALLTFDQPEKPFPDDSSFVVLSYNIGYGSGMTNNLSIERDPDEFKVNLSRAIHLINKYKPDFVGFQEIDFDANRSFHVDQLSALAKGSGFPFAYKSVNWDLRYVPFPYFPPSVHFGQVVSGQAILSRYPITESKTHTLAKVRDQPFYYKPFYLDRLAQVSKINLGESEIVVINVHTEAFDKDTRTKQMHYLLDLYRQYADEYPVLLIGDFNSSPANQQNTDPSIDVLLREPGLASACPPDHFDLTSSFTYPADAPDEQLDYIFYNKSKIRPMGWAILSDFTTISDHLPIYFQFKLRNNNNEEE